LLPSERRGPGDLAELVSGAIFDILEGASVDFHLRMTTAFTLGRKILSVQNRSVDTYISHIEDGTLNTLHSAILTTNQLSIGVPVTVSRIGNRKAERDLAKSRRYTFAPKPFRPSGRKAPSSCSELFVERPRHAGWRVNQTYPRVLVRYSGSVGSARCLVATAQIRVGELSTINKYQVSTYGTRIRRIGLS
jgi:hypothetical protein